MRAALIVAASLGLMPCAASAQATWLSEEAPTATVELLRPSFSLPRFSENGERIGDAHLTAASAALFATVRHPFDQIDVVAEIPLAIGGIDDGETGAMLGNVYLGAEYGARRPWSIRAGLRLPTAPDFDSTTSGTRAIGVLASPGDRLQAFDRISSAFIASIQHVNRPSRFVEARFSAGGARIAYEDADAAFGLLLAGQAILDYEKTRIGGGISVNFNFDQFENGLEDGQQFEVWVDRAFGRIRPGIIARRVMGAEAINHWDNPLVFGVKAEVAF